MVAFLVAGVILIASISTLLFNTRTASVDQESHVDEALLQSRAGTLLELLTNSPGAGGDGADWINLDPSEPDSGPDKVKRLGIRNFTSRDLDFGKFVHLGKAPLAADGGDGFINYDEAVSSLGLSSAGLGFHVRAYPSLKAVQEILGSGDKDPNLRVTFIADYEKSGATGALPSITSYTCDESPVDNQVHRINATITNLGTATTQFNADFTVTFPSATPGNETFKQVTNTFLVTASSTAIAYVDVPNKGGRICDSNTRIDLAIYDPNSKWAEETAQPLDTIIANAGSTSSIELTADTSKTYFDDSDDMIIEYGGDINQNDAITLTIRPGEDPLAAPTYTDTTTAPKQSQKRTFTIPAASIGPGDYTVYIKHDATGVEVTDRLLVVTSPVSDYVPTGGSGTDAPTNAALIEVNFLHDLVEKFCPYLYSSTADPDSLVVPAPGWTPRCSGFQGGAQPSDVFPDLKTDLNNELPLRLLDGTGAPRYDETNTLVVGSNVDHNAMTSASAKHAVRDWVLGGGTLIVFGSEDQQVQWLQPIFHAGIESSSGGINAPDTSHPMLQVSDDLDWDNYDNNGKSWKLNSGSADLFTNVVEGNDGPILAISDPGAFGDGTIIITTWLPYDLFGDGSDATAEGLKLVNNVLMQGYRELFLDYGPPIPKGTSVVPALGKAQVIHPKIGPVMLDIIVFVFPAA